MFMLRIDFINRDGLDFGRGSLAFGVFQETGRLAAEQFYCRVDG